MGNKSSLETVIGVLAATSTQIGSCADSFTGNPATDVIRMTRDQEIIFFIAKLSGAVGTFTPTVESCDNFTPTTPTAVAYEYRKMTTNGTWGAVTRATSAGFLSTAGADQMYAISVRGSQLVDGDIAVRLQITETDSTAVEATITAVLLQGRYSSATPLSFIS